MADGIEQKLNMSLDDLAKQERKEEYSKLRSRANQRQQGWYDGKGKTGQMHQDRQHRRLYSPHGLGSRDMPVLGTQPVEWGQMQQGWVDSQPVPVGQQLWQNMPRGQFGPARASVFSRLADVRQQQYQQLPPKQYQELVQQQPPPPRQRQQLQQQPAQPKPVQNPPTPKLDCRLDKDTGLVIIQHEGSDIVKVGPGGDVTLDSAGDRSPSRLAAINAALNHIHMSVKQVGDNWSVSDGKGLSRFADGMKLPAKGPLTAGRAMVLLQALTAGQSKAAATAAQQASTQAAIAAGIMPRAAGVSGVAVDEGAAAAQVRRLKAQGRYAPY